ncbi:MAG: hypothetical protein P4L51_10700 [Puia sp.]|nr:hypothetical protein [Puia sp.]
MKKILLFSTLLLSAGSCGAQTFAEWFEQKKTELRYYAEQIAAFQAFASDLAKGNSLVSQGLELIGTITGNEQDLHRAFFASQQTVNPAVTRSTPVDEILAYQAAIADAFRQARQRFEESGMLTTAEQGYFDDVYTNLSKEIGKDLDELTAILTDYELTMSDDQRIRRIDRIYKDMQGKYVFTQSWIAQVQWLCWQRAAEQNEIETMRNLRGY